MALRMFDFECEQGHRHEAMVAPETRADACPQCGGDAKRLIASPRISLEGISGDFPTAADKWVKRRESKMKQERRNKERHGTYT